jgi:hypothetical protein
MLERAQQEEEGWQNKGWFRQDRLNAEQQGDDRRRDPENRQVPGVPRNRHTFFYCRPL